MIIKNKVRQINSMDYEIGFHLINFDDWAKKQRSYNDFKVAIQNYRCIIIKDTAIIYTYQLALILFAKNLPVIRLDDKEEMEINCNYFYDIFIDNYNKGVEYWEKNYYISPHIFNSVNTKIYERDIHRDYFHSGYNKKGWNFVIREYPLLLNCNEIKKFGFYSGIISMVGEMIVKYPEVFKGFNLCEIQ